MLRKLTIFIFLAALTALPLRAQYYQTGSDPASARWSRIKGEHFDVIYPRETDSLAREFLYSFEKTRSANLVGLHIESEHVPIILHPYDMYSNGMVVWAPKRIELMTTPPYEALYPMNWEMQLATHEGRHMGQMAHYTKGIYKVLMYLTGEQGIAIGVGFYPSKTLLEGDAVQNETDLTGAGRGRNPEFLKYYRAAFLEGDIRKYDNWRYGSYHKFTPDKYAFGFMINSAMRENSGNYFVTGDIMAEQVKSWWRLFSVSHRSYIRASGLTTRKNWRYAVARNNEQWSWEYEMRAPYTRFEPVMQREKYYSSITNPLPLNDGVYATMSGMQYERRIVSIDSLGKAHWKRPFSSNTSALAADSDHSFVFSEIIPDPRWEHRSWSVIRRYDASTGKIKTLTRHTRYVNPTATSDGQRILAADYKVTGGSDVVILNKDGILVERIEGPEHGQILNAVQLGDDLYTSAITTEGAGIFRHVADNGWERIVAPQLKAIRDLRAAGDSLLYFVSDLDGISSIYTLNPSSGKLDQLTNTRFSATTPFLAGDGTLWYSDFDALGYQPVKVTVDDQEFKEASFGHPFMHPQAEHNALQAKKYVTPLTAEEDSLLRESVANLESHPYRKSLHGIHIHSWFPFYANVKGIMNDIGRFNLDNWYEMLAPGATLVSQNDLGTVVAMAAYSYRHKKYRDYHGAHLNVSYSGLYPVIELSADFNDRDRMFTEYRFNSRNDTVTMRYERGNNALTASALVYVPINLSRGGWISRLTPQLRYIYTNDQESYKFGSGYSIYDISTKGTHSARGAISYYAQLAQPSARIRPRLGFGATAMFQAYPGRGILSHYIGAVNLYAYVPGFTKEDNFKLTYNHQRREGGLITNEQLVRIPRGYDADNIFLKDYHGASLDYAFPVNFDGLSGGWFFYLKRLQFIPFVDYGYNKGDHMASADMSFLVNTYLFRIGTELKLGVQYSHTLEGVDRFRFIMSTDF